MSLRIVHHDEMENSVTPASAPQAVPVDLMQDTPKEFVNPEEGSVEAESPDREIEYDDPKYQKVLDYLIQHGYQDAKFLGKMGFYIPANTSYAKLVLDDIFCECSVMASRMRLSPASAIEYAAELTKLSDEANDINAILADATDAGTKDRHVDESCSSQELIQTGSQKFGSAGTYLLYRNGSHQTSRGFIGFTDTKLKADRYGKNGSETETFVVTINDPYVSQADTSKEAFINAYSALLGKDPEFPENAKINDAWRAMDKEMADELTKLGHDSLIYLVPQNNEVNVLGSDIDKMPSINKYDESVPQAVGNQ